MKGGDPGVRGVRPGITGAKPGVKGEGEGGVMGACRHRDASALSSSNSYYHFGRANRLDLGFIEFLVDYARTLTSVLFDILMQGLPVSFAFLIRCSCFLLLRLPFA